MRDLGCQLALDDFGSGYASFRYLRIFPIDLVKIDGEYVVDLVNNPQDQVLVRALVQVCQAYGIHTVAEFVGNVYDKVGVSSRAGLAARLLGAP